MSRPKHEFENTAIEDIEYVRNTEFERLKNLIYLDHAGATLYAKSQLDRCHHDLLSNIYGNPHSKNSSSKCTAELIDCVRLRILDFFNTTPEDYSVIFTSGSTAALKLVGDHFVFGRHETATHEDLHFHRRSSREHGHHSASCKGCLCYLDDNHTSVVGLREIADTKGAGVICVDQDLTERCFHQSPECPSKVPHWMCSPHTCSGPTDNTACKCVRNNLFAVPAQSNFSGYRYPLQWLSKVKEGQLKCVYPGNWYTLLDAASYVCTSPLDLSQYLPDFVCLSFYKIFGYPTGLGALLVHNEAASVLRKTYFGGGSVAVSVATEQFHVDRQSLSDRFEDGTVSYLDILAVKHGFDVLQVLTGGIENISQHTFTLARYVYHSLDGLRHYNDMRVVELYTSTAFEDSTTQGPIISFNIKRADGTYVGFASFDQLAQLHSIHVRTGCFCNMGACQKFLNISPQQIKDNFKAGHSCGDNMDLVNNLPTGGVRVSLGYMNTRQDVEAFVKFVADCFVECHDSKLTETATENGTLVDMELYTLRNVYLYPVKSCAAFEVTSWEVGEKGFHYDREWAIIDQNGVTLSQKREPKLGLIKPVVDIVRNVLVLSYEGSTPLEVDINESQDELDLHTCQTKVCGKRVQCTDCGAGASQWLDAVLGYVGCKLIRQHSDRQSSKLNGSSKLSLANQGQFLLICTASVRLLDQQIKNRHGSAIGIQNLIDRFRSNLVVETTEPYEEDGWSSVNIGGTSLLSHGACSRCQMICIDPATGEKSCEPLRTLSQTRGKRVPFGALFNLAELACSRRLTVGDKVTDINMDPLS